MRICHKNIIDTWKTFERIRVWYIHMHTMYVQYAYTWYTGVHVHVATHVDRVCLRLLCDLWN